MQTRPYWLNVPFKGLVLIRSIVTLWAHCIKCLSNESKNATGSESNVPPITTNNDELIEISKSEYRADKETSPLSKKRELAIPMLITQPQNSAVRRANTKGNRLILHAITAATAPCTRIVSMI